MYKTKDEGWDPWKRAMLVQKSEFWMQKTIGAVWDPLRLAILVLKSLFCIQKPQMRAGTHRD